MPQWQEALYRVATEALNNALKYASATVVNVRLSSEAGWLEVEIADNGQGFDVAEATSGGGLGLTTMQERIEQLNGRLNIETARGRGTQIRVRLPWPVPPPSQEIPT